MNNLENNLLHILVALACIIFMILGGPNFYGCIDSNSNNPDKTETKNKLIILQQHLNYFQDTRTNLCFAQTGAQVLTVVPCSPEVIKLAIPIYK